jgi:lipopolysaccharide transport system permease protein
MRQRAHWFNLLRHFVAREIKQRYLGSLSGALWAIAQPLLLLAVYAVVFVEIMKVRLPTAVGGDYVPFMACGLWAWTAFAESINRGVTAITDHASLLAKVAMPREVLVLAPVAAAFVLHGVGLIAVTVLLRALGKDIYLSALPVSLFCLLLLGCFAAGLALLLASVHVFVRDLAHVVAQTLVLWFFLTPVFYAREMMPDRIAAALAYNPITPFVESVRQPLLGAMPSIGQWGWTTGLAVLMLFVGVAVFGRLSRHFEDFL